MLFSLLYNFFYFIIQLTKKDMPNYRYMSPWSNFILDIDCFCSHLMHSLLDYIKARPAFLFRNTLRSVWVLSHPVGMPILQRWVVVTQSTRPFNWTASVHARHLVHVLCHDAVDFLRKHLQLSLWEIVVHVSTAEFTAQTLYFAYLNGDFVRWCCSYKTRISLKDSNSLEMIRATARWHVFLNG